MLCAKHLKINFSFTAEEKGWKNPTFHISLHSISWKNFHAKKLLFNKIISNIYLFGEDNCNWSLDFITFLSISSNLYLAIYYCLFSWGINIMLPRWSFCFTDCNRLRIHIYFITHSSCVFIRKPSTAVFAPITCCSHQWLILTAIFSKDYFSLWLAVFRISNLTWSKHTKCIYLSKTSSF